MRIWAILVLVGCGSRTPTVTSGRWTEPELPPARTTQGMVHHTWPQPITPGFLKLSLQPRSTIIIQPLGPSPVRLSEQKRIALERRVDKSRDLDRIALLDRIAQALEYDAEEDLDQQAKVAAAGDAYLVLLAEPMLDKYAHADSVLVRAGRLLPLAGRSDAGRQALERAIQGFPGSKYAADALIALAEDTTDRDLARALLDRAIANANGPLRHFARLKLAAVLHDQQEHQEALALLTDVATNGGDRFREVAAHLAIEPYLVVGKPRAARAFFARLDPGRENALVRDLARGWIEVGRLVDAEDALQDLLATERDLNAICANLVVLFPVNIQRRPGLVTEAAEALVKAADRAAPTCRSDADSLLADAALARHFELPKSGLDPEVVVTLWHLALRVATSPVRRSIELRNRAYLLWQMAERENGRDADAWLRAADAMKVAADASLDDPRLGAAALDARRNAQLATNPADRRRRERR